MCQASVLLLAPRGALGQQPAEQGAAAWLATTTPELHSRSPSYLKVCLTSSFLFPGHFSVALTDESMQPRACAFNITAVH